MGATDGNIIAAIITTHTPRNHAAVPSEVQGPPSIPFISCAVHHHPTAASAKSTAHQLGLVTIGIAVGAILLTAALEVRRRRGIEGPPVPPPPEIVGAPEITGG